MFGCTNVGFHMGNEITVDFDVELSSEQISLIETKANEAVYKNVSVRVDFPEEKATLFGYRFLIPIMIALKMSNMKQYQDFINGSDPSPLDILDSPIFDNFVGSYLLSSNEAFESHAPSIIKVSRKDKLIETYNALFSNYSNQPINIGQITISRDVKKHLQEVSSLITDISYYGD